MGLIGERLNDGSGTESRLVRMPAAASGYLRNGMAFDSGTAHIVHDCISHLAHESVRPLFVSPGPGTIGSKTTGYDGLEDAPVLTGTDGAALPQSQISWDRRTARRYGPFPGVPDWPVDGAAGDTLRSVRVFLDVDIVSASSTTFYAAMTTGTSRPDQDLIVIDTPQTPSSTGRKLLKFTLVPAAPYFHTDTETCRPESQASYANTIGGTFFYSIWVGWWWQSGSAPGVIACSAWESREYP